MTTQLSVSMKQLKSLLQKVSPEIVVCIRGRHAVGKSEAVAQFAESIGLPLVMRRLSQMTEGDLLGVPSKVETKNGGNATTFHPCEWLIRACEEPVVLFLDERNRALDAVKQAVFEICDSRAFYGHTLHPQTRVVIAENVGDNYQVQQCDPAEVSRTATVELDPTPAEWVEYAKSRCHPALVEYIQQNPNDLEFVGKSGYEPNKKYPDRRSWFKLDRQLQDNNLYDSPEDIDFYTLVGAMVGPETAQKFTAFCKNRDKQVGAKDILKSWENVKKRLGGAERISNERYVEFGTKLDEHLKKNKLTKPEAKQIVQFLHDCPPEPRMALYAAITTSNMDNTKLIHEDVAALMVSTIKGTQADKK
jgi:hypothetical protein